jgi:hypothetical protein
LEGAGSVYQSCLFAYIVSILFGLRYYHHPNYVNTFDEATQEEFRTDWEKIFGLFRAKGELLEEFFHEEIFVHYKFIPKYQDINYGLVANIDFHSAHAIVRENWDKYKAEIYLQLLTQYKKFNSYAPKIDYLKNQDFNICLHLRTRNPGDLPVEECGPWQNFDLSQGQKLNTEYYSKLYSSLLSGLISSAKQQVNKRVVVHIFSKGEPSLFDSICSGISGADGINLNLEANATDAFHAFTNADFLICAHSSFSWLASHLNPNPSFIRRPFRQILSPNGYYFDDDLKISRG